MLQENKNFTTDLEITLLFYTSLDETIEPELFYPKVDQSDDESAYDFYSGKNESDKEFDIESDKESYIETDIESEKEYDIQNDKEEGTDEDEVTDMYLETNKKPNEQQEQEKARAPKKSYLNNKRNKKLKLDIDNLPEKFAAKCSTGN